MSFEWSRPMDTVPYPNVWMEFEAKETKNSDKVIKYRIQDVPEDRFEELIQFHCENYIRDDPMLQSIDAEHDQDYIDDTILFLRGVLKQKMSTICVREDTNEIVGESFLMVCTKKDTFISETAKHFKSKGLTNQLKILNLVDSKMCPFEKYNVDVLLGSSGLMVSRKYRGLGIGVKLLQTRKLVANAFNIKLAHSHFTSNYSNNCAKIAGYQEDLRFTFDELEATIPGLNYGDVDSKFYGVYSWQF